MLLGPSCACTLCHIEARLLGSLAVPEHGTFAGFAESGPLRQCSSVSELVSLLRASPADARSDKLLCELLQIHEAWPAFIEGLLVLAFVPMLHRTIRRVATYQPALAEEDIAQQGLSFLLEFLRSEEMRARHSHFAFAISRAVKRRLFVWARHEGTEDALHDYGSETFLALSFEESFERHSQLRHFLERCVRRGDLTEAELDLFVQFKLEGTHSEDFENAHGSLSNALRQRLKRQLAKLRRLAR